VQDTGRVRTDQAQPALEKAQIAKPTVPEESRGETAKPVNDRLAELAAWFEARSREAPAAAPAPGAVRGEVRSPDARYRWRFSANGLDYSQDGGGTWQQVSAAIGQLATAGAAPSPTVCWIVARGGAVYATTDGRTFSRVPFPETADLTAVTATDARIATVTTADGRTFRTDDGGKTWRRL
jgi:hypothetical protein